MNISSRDAWLNVNDDYNNGMGSVDIADQLRLFYRFHHWMRKSKWWHSIFWWGFGVQLVNAYKCYTTYHRLRGSKALSHYDFQKNVGDAWVSNDEAVATAKSAAYSTKAAGPSLNSETTRRDRFCAAALDPQNGSLRRRLRTGLGHWPYPTTKPRSYCQLCRWSSNDSAQPSPKKKARKYANVVQCEECDVNLCTGDCFRRFHHVWDLMEKKQNI